MPKLEPPTTEMVIAAGKELESCPPELKRALEKMYPAAFDTSVKMNQHSTIRLHSLDRDADAGISMVWVSGGGKAVALNHNFNWERNKPGGNIFTPTRK